jgi:hypothetical protein
MKLYVIFLTGFLLLLSSGICAQDKPDLFQRIELVFQQKESDWKVERVYGSTSSDPLTEDIVFRSGEDQAAIKVEIWKRPEDARDVFGSTSIAFDSSKGKRMEKASLAGVGDENHFWTHPGSTAWPTLKFRKGNVTVSVFGPSTTVVKRFGEHILTQVTTK